MVCLLANIYCGTSGVGAGPPGCNFVIVAQKLYLMLSITLAQYNV